VTVPRPLALAVGGAALAAGLAVGLHPATVLEIENAERGRTFRTALGPGEAFEVVTRHSLYDQPVTEEFAVEDGLVVLRAVSSPSAAVREYFGILGPGERHAAARAMREVIFRVAMGTPQRLRVAGVERSFLELGAPGDRLVLRAARRSAAARCVMAFGARAAP
jgi:hypothetical protein